MFVPYIAVILRLFNSYILCIVYVLVNSSEAGEGTVTADVRHVGLEVACDVELDEEDKDQKTNLVLFAPKQSGTYFVYVNFNGIEIAGSNISFSLSLQGTFQMLPKICIIVFTVTIVSQVRICAHCRHFHEIHLSSPF